MKKISVREHELGKKPIKAILVREGGKDSLICPYCNTNESIPIDYVTSKFSGSKQVWPLPKCRECGKKYEILF